MFVLFIFYFLPPPSDYAHKTNKWKVENAAIETKGKLMLCQSNLLRSDLPWQAE